MAYKITTKRGYDFFEVASALQKSIRRSKELDSVYWATELFVSGKDQYLWKRLMVIASEDIGLADPDMTTRIWNLYQMYEYGGKSNIRDRSLFVYQAVILLVRCDKSRLVDWARNYALDNHWLERKEIPDYALDQHTRRGKQMGRSCDHFFDVGAKLDPDVNLPHTDYYENWCRKWWTPEGGKKIKAERAKFDAFDPKNCDETRPGNLFEQGD